MEQRPPEREPFSVDLIRHLIHELERETDRMRVELGSPDARQGGPAPAADVPASPSTAPHPLRRELPQRPPPPPAADDGLSDRAAPAAVVQQAEAESGDEREFRNRAETELRRAQRYVEQSLPFIIFCLLVLLQRAWIGIVTFSWLTMLCMRSNDIVKAQAALKENISVAYLGVWAVFTLSHIVCMSIVFGASSFLPRLALLPPAAPLSFADALCAVAVADAVARLLTVLSKGAVVQAKLHLDEPRRRGLLFSALEAASSLYRGVLPVPVWLAYLSDTTFPDVFAAAVSGLYIALKLSHTVDRARVCWAACRSYHRRELPFGRLATAADIAEDPNCAICHDAMQGPVVLACGHCFCQGCVEAWFERERSCPLCRAFVRTAGLGRHADGSTTLLPALF